MADTALTMEKMKRALAALRRAGELHDERMADPVYRAIFQGLACPLPIDLACGISITRDGERIDPFNFYVLPPGWRSELPNSGIR